MSTSPAISTTDSEGNYVVLTNEITELFFWTTSKNEAVKCNTVSGSCEALILTNEEGESLR